MHTDESILPSNRNIKAIAVCVLCLLVLHVLSIGPVAKLDDGGMVGRRTSSVLKLIYSPLTLLQPIPGMKPIFNWYIFHVWKCDTMGDNTI